MALTESQVLELKAAIRERFAPQYIDVAGTPVLHGPHVHGEPDSPDEKLVLQDWEIPPADIEAAKDRANWGGQMIECTMDQYVALWGEELYPEYCGGAVSGQTIQVQTFGFQAMAAEDQHQSEPQPKPASAETMDRITRKDKLDQIGWSDIMEKLHKQGKV
jgi:hypothetical protein